MTEAKKEKDMGFHRKPAVEDFGESGDHEGLYKKYELSEDNIAAKALELFQD